MNNILEKIIHQKKIEIKKLYEKDIHRNIPNLKEIFCQNSLKKTLQNNKFSIIGEIKKRSPSKGLICTSDNLVPLIKDYVARGISALSVLTDENFFSGSIYDLRIARLLLNNSSIPILRKEFIIDKIQILESYLVGADAILLIVAVLKDKTKELFTYAKKFGLDVLMEVHNIDELNFALNIGADIIGINNRNLINFEENINNCIELSKYIPEHIITIAESSIKTNEHIKEIKNTNFNGALIGETIIKSEKPSKKIKELMEGIL